MSPSHFIPTWNSEDGMKNPSRTFPHRKCERAKKGKRKPKMINYSYSAILLGAFEAETICVPLRNWSREHRVQRLESSPTGNPAWLQPYTWEPC